MRVLVIGSGGREHALVWKISQSPLVREIHCAPGNPGIEELARCVRIASTDKAKLLDFASKNEIDLTVVGPEQPLVDGIVDEFEAQGLRVFGPSQKAAELEGSKAFSKYLLGKYKIPTAKCVVFDEHQAAEQYLAQIDYPIVIKADGLAAGKGAVVCHNEEQATETLRKIMVDKRFGDAGNKVLVEEFLVGEEASVLALTDGERVTYLASSQDHKAIFDDDLGPNTGGMGAYAPAPVLDAEMLERVKNEIIMPTVKAMALEDRPYRGVLYAGLMITAEGPKVVEFNCRFGDPETQVVLPLVKGDLMELMLRIASGKQIDKQIELYEDRWALCVVIASGGYPEAYEKGKPIYGLGQGFDSQLLVFHAGTVFNERNQVVTDGGRVLGVTAVAGDFHRVREKAYWAVGKITFDRAYYRKDIGAKALKYLR